MDKEPVPGTISLLEPPANQAEIRRQSRIVQITDATAAA